ncbi:MAG: class I tRNA ligase family protein [Phycisphaerales bacterium]
MPILRRSTAFDAPHFPPLRPARFVGRDPYPKGSPSPADLLRSQRRLPHVELEKATYFVTWRVVDGESLSDDERRIVKDAVGYWHERGDEVFALSVMTTHMHALVRLHDGGRLGAWCESIKRFSAREINKRRGETGSIWLTEQFDHVVRDEADLAEFTHYIVNNAVAAGVAARATEDRFAWVSEEVAGLVEAGGNRESLKAGASVEGVGSPARRAGPPSGPPPFRDVYINPIIQDGHGQRMSKSLGNGVDPLDIVHSHGADAMRFVLTQIATSTQDVRMPVDLVCPHTGKTFEPKFVTSPQGYLVAAPFQESPGDPSKKMVSPYGAASGAARPSDATPLARNTSSKFDIGRNFCNKLWNASRFALGILEKAGAVGGSGATDTGCKPVPPESLSLVDRWMLSRVRATTEAVAQSIRSYHFSSYAQAMYDLMWRDFCDWYLEAIKPTVAQSREQQAVLAHSLESIVRLLHPLVPFITEAIWEHLRNVGTAPIAEVTLKASRVDGLLATAGWPELAESLRDEKAEADFGRMQALAGAIREVRAKHQVPPKRRIVLHASAALANDIGAAGGIVEALCTLSRVETGPPSGDAAAVAVAFTFEAVEYQLSELADAVDLGAERERLEKQIADLRKSIAALDGRLSNPGYVDRAPAHLVQQTRDERARKDADLNAAIAALGRLG